MERSLDSRRRRLRLELGAALLAWNHERLAEEGMSAPMQLEQALGIRTTVNGNHYSLEIESGAEASPRPSSDSLSTEQESL
jgi:hypothetical protein